MKISKTDCLRTPKADGFYMPGEFEPHEGTLMIWPWRPGSWNYGAKAARAAFAEIAEAIAPQFKETNLNTIETIVSRYYEQDTWKDNLIFEEKSFELLQDILESAEELDTRAPYNKLVTTTFAEKAAK